MRTDDLARQQTIDAGRGHLVGGPVPVPRRRRKKLAEWPNKNGSSIGSYGFALQALSEGLANALRLGWIDEEEAKAEFRSHVKSIQEKESRAKKAASLRAEADELDAA